ncbi:hypothetical protein EDD86DRAFT_274416 [Gorgonomyces haynaldii]|nr:hypothetical protein EDD86DRAFT_274416 [Gorgonomyces haynaldii]
MEFQLSQELLEKEQLYRKKNQQLSEQAKAVVLEAESVVKQGKELLTRPMTAPSAPAAEEPSRKATRSQKARTPEPRTGLPEQMNDMGQEATARFLKAKMQALEQELTRLVTERQAKDMQSQGLEEKVKHLEQELSKSHKQNKILQQSNDKLKKQTEQLTVSNENLQQELSQSKKTVDSQKRELQQLHTDMNAKDVRLNRALEELDRSKTVSNTGEKEHVETARRTADGLFLENKRLAKQKLELMNAFKKQQQLIEILKRQKVFRLMVDAH